MSNQLPDNVLGIPMRMYTAKLPASKFMGEYRPPAAGVSLLEVDFDNTYKKGGKSIPLYSTEGEDAHEMADAFAAAYEIESWNRPWVLAMTNGIISRVFQMRDNVVEGVIATFTYPDGEDADVNWVTACFFATEFAHSMGIPVHYIVEGV